MYVTFKALGTQNTYKRTTVIRCNTGFNNNIHRAATSVLQMCYHGAHMKLVS